MRKILSIIILLISALTISAQKQAYIIYTSKGKKVSYEKMLKTIKDKDLILFGELHNNPISHWLEYELAADLSENRPLDMGAEIFEADNQQAINDYLSGKYTTEQFDTSARFWPNYKTDYAPLVELAKSKKLSFTASNIPRKYASMVYKKGIEILDSLPETEKQFMTPLPMQYDPELKSYKDMLKMAGGHGSPRMIAAQAVKDATMAYFIIENMHEEHTFLHFNGAYHSDFYEGILWHILKSRPDTTYATISTVLQKNVNKLDAKNINRADFIICVTENMTSSY